MASKIILLDESFSILWNLLRSGVVRESVEARVTNINGFLNTGVMALEILSPSINCIWLLFHFKLNSNNVLPLPSLMACGKLP